ncbi:S4 domain-containing protein YaaA [Aliibacillus thermotolerans]|uniref:S4 domain-containing protein YaaA n=1 Tax=Aliibacillus thermotolerans TaxID=1834418 RepID=A0ABW0U5Q9_9BACI|nr:S4 domain-containing protein YaaA [Aliibacillus thermotolerans]MDA3129309.1 S4 domain-containing protein YaaA [Aliibacillus thermotolerans]
MAKSLSIQTEYITLGQMLKEVGLIDTGGMAKHFLAERMVKVNGEREDRRGRKLYDGDEIEIEDTDVYIVSSMSK